MTRSRQDDVLARRAPEGRKEHANAARRLPETSDAGSVPELVVSNPTGHRVLLYDGEEPEAFALLWPKLRAGYLLDALERLDGRATSVERVAQFVDSVGTVRATHGPSAGLGDDFRLRPPRAAASARRGAGGLDGDDRPRGDRREARDGAPEAPQPRIGAGASGRRDTARRSADERPEPRSWR